MTDTVLRLAGITKRFGSLVAHDAIDLDLGRGEVLALLGENGAGKTTLMNILFGHYVADAGSVSVAGADGVLRPLPPGSPHAALAAGIGMVHQHFTLADNLSVQDNVMLGTEPLWQPFSRRAAARSALLDAAQRFGLAVDPDARIAELSVGERQRVEILKALVSFGRKQGARILILDEPTAVLTPQESESLFATLAQMVAQGLSVIFISHKLGEVLRVSDRIAVLRAGRLVAELPAAAADKAQLAEAMVGRRVAPAVKRSRAAGPVVAALQTASVRGHGARPLLQDIDLELHAGEVVAVAGVAGNGQQALAELLCGELALDGGSLTVQGRSLPAEPRRWVEAGVARIPEDRHAVGVIGDLPLWENAVLERYASGAFARRGVLRRGRALGHAGALVQRFDVRGHRRRRAGHRDALAVGRQHAEADPRPRAGRRPRRRGRAAADRRQPADLGPGHRCRGLRAPAAARRLRRRQRGAADQRGPRRDLRARRPHRGDAPGAPRRRQAGGGVDTGRDRPGDGGRAGACGLNDGRRHRPRCWLPRPSWPWW